MESIPCPFSEHPVAGASQDTSSYYVVVVPDAIYLYFRPVTPYLFEPSLAAAVAFVPGAGEKLLYPFLSCHHVAVGAITTSRGNARVCVGCRRRIIASPRRPVSFRAVTCSRGSARVCAGCWRGIIVCSFSSCRPVAVRAYTTSRGSARVCKQPFYIGSSCIGSTEIIVWRYRVTVVYVIIVDRRRRHHRGSHFGYVFRPRCGSSQILKRGGESVPHPHLPGFS